MKPAAVLAAALVVVVIALPGCGESGGGSGASQIEIVTAPELASPQEALLPGESRSAWTSDHALLTRLSGSDDLRDAPARVEAAITGAGDRLAAVDYPALSLPAFVTYTRQMKLRPEDFAGGKAELDSVVPSQGGPPKWALYQWQGPTLPMHPDRPLVTRWTYVYALYDPAAERVVRLLATIRGQVEE